MSQAEAFDIVVIGAGIAGLVAANRAAELGSRVLVLEKGQEEAYLCNSRYTGGFFHVGMQDINSGPQRLLEIVRELMKEDCDEALARSLADNAGRGVQWLRAQGIRFIKVGPEGYKSTVLAPPGLRQTGLHWQGRGGDVMLRTLGDILVRHRGGRLVRGVRATGLVMEAGRCTGVEVEGALSGRIASTAVIIADGGFQGDPERMRREVSPRPELLLQRGAATGVGDGARMAEAAGAKLVKLDSVYGHVLHRDALTNPALWPYPVLDMVIAAGIAVDGAGRRFCDEGLGGVYVTNAIARLPDPAGAIAICDQAIWDGPAREFLLPANPHLEAAGGEIIVADSIAALAQRLGLDPAVLAETVESYNAACASGDFSRLTPIRSSAPFRPMPVQQGPFRAVRLCAGVTYTLGGIATDGRGQALSRDDRPMPGLYAAGSATGGLEGGRHIGYTGGLSKALVFGLLAAEAAHQARQAA